VLSDHRAVAAEARRSADENADRASVRLRELSSNDECTAASDLLATIWGTAREASPASSDLLRSLVHAGGCVVGAIDDQNTVVGVAVALAGGPLSDGIYSFIAGVAREHPHGGVGTALKQYQRGWALERGASTMTWTFDPLVRRNARFNLDRLGARVTEYVPDFYPPMHDALNRADATDRCTVVWDLVAPAPGGVDDRAVFRLLEADEDGEPLVHPITGRPSRASAWVPPDIEGLRRHAPPLAGRWRWALREAMSSSLRTGYRVDGISREGRYLLVREGVA
jgi:predicted GNAT superfamily acetyltransferase